MNAAEQFLNTELSITDYDIEVVEIPFKQPVHLPFGTIESRPSAWLHVYGKAEGAAGVGVSEGTALPMQIPMYDDYSANLAPNVHAIMHDISGSSMTVQEARQHIGAVKLGGNFNTARMTVETGLLDLGARAQDKTVFEVLTGEKLTEPLAIPYGKSIAENDYDRIVTAGQNAIENGAKRLKFKLSPANHQSVVAAITELKAQAPDASLMVDANGTFDPGNSEHIAILRLVDELGLLMIEEPVSRGGAKTGLVAHAQLRDLVEFQTPIALDDAISTKNDALLALESGLGEIINLKPGRVGSFLDCIEMAVQAKKRGKQIMVGGMFEATPGRTMTLTLAAICLRMGFKIPGDVSLPQERLSSDLIKHDQLHLDDTHSVVFAPKRGWGYEL